MNPYVLQTGNFFSPATAIFDQPIHRLLSYRAPEIAAESIEELRDYCAAATIMYLGNGIDDRVLYLYR